MMETAVAGHPTLVITSDDGSRRVIALSGRDLRIGRSSENDVVLPDAAKGVSRTHAELRMDGTHYVIVDLHSQNGTWLDGERVQEATVAPGAEIAIGTYRLRVEIPAPVTLAVDDILLRDPSRAIPRAVVRQPSGASVSQAATGRGAPVAVYAALIAAVVVAGIAWLFWPSSSTAVPAGVSVEHTAGQVPAAAAAAVTPSAEIPVGDVARTGTDGQTPEPPAATSEPPVAAPESPVAVPGPPAAASEAPGRAAARDAFEVGTRLYAAEDWVAAMQKFDEARRADATLPGLERAAKAVREKMRAAGRAAFNRAREYDAIGQSSEALKEYDRAVQWLPADDVNRAAAVSRAAKLRAR